MRWGSFVVGALSGVAAMTAGLVATSRKGNASSPGAPTLAVEGESRRRFAPDKLDDIPVVAIAEYIDLTTARRVLTRMDTIAEPFVLLLHTQGGYLIAAMMIAEALAQREQVIAVVPDYAFSGGTILALTCTQILAGPLAFLSPVDPQIDGCPVREMEDSTSAQYVGLVSQWVAAALRELSVPEESQAELVRLFDGSRVPHGWPLSLRRLAELGLPVSAIPPRWLVQLGKFRGAL